MNPTMDPWDFRTETVQDSHGAIIDHIVELRTEQAWVDVKLPDGGVIRVDGSGEAWRQSY